MKSVTNALTNGRQAKQIVPANECTKYTNTILYFCVKKKEKNHYSSISWLLLKKKNTAYAKNMDIKGALFRCVFLKK